ncbi:hypothetical protein CTAM01_13893, partial [Colletotrichum tamarilloi]
TSLGDLSNGQTDFQSCIPPSRSIPQACLGASSSSSSFSLKTTTQSHESSLKELASSHRRGASSASSASLAIHIYTSPSASYILHTFTHHRIAHLLHTPIRADNQAPKHQATKPERPPSPLAIFPTILPNEARLEKCSSGWTRS